MTVCSGLHWRAIAFAEQIVADNPFLAAAVTPQLSAAEIKRSPIRPPLFGVVRAVRLGE
jgi:hypothetical protein